jgi:hypothetical protein
MSDFILACHPEDIELNGVPIPNIEHVDDILTDSGAPPVSKITSTGHSLGLITMVVKPPSRNTCIKYLAHARNTIRRSISAGIQSSKSKRRVIWEYGW